MTIKKITRSRLLASAMSVTLVTGIALKPAPSQSAIGGVVVAFGGLIGLAGMAAGAGIILGSVEILKNSKVQEKEQNEKNQPTKKNSMKILGFVGLAIGAIILNDDKEQFQFTPLQTELAQKLDISEDELIAFNSEIDELNAVLEDVDTTLANENFKNSEKFKKRAIELIEEYRATIDPSAFNVAMKVAYVITKQNK